MIELYFGNWFHAISNSRTTSALKHQVHVMFSWMLSLQNDRWSSCFFVCMISGNGHFWKKYLRKYKVISYKGKHSPGVILFACYEKAAI